jgi:hypothetical protein
MSRKLLYGEEWDQSCRKGEHVWDKPREVESESGKLRPSTLMFIGEIEEQSWIKLAGTPQ